MDRDGVLNEATVIDGAPYSPRTLADFRIIDFAMDSLQRLKTADYALVVVTNQPDIGRGLMSQSTLDEMHHWLMIRSGIEQIEVCPHTGPQNCDCRKPKPGMILRAAAALGIDPARSWTVGDRWVDIAAGATAGTRTALVARPYSFRPTSDGSPPESLQPDITGLELSELVDEILRRDSSTV
ncbi:MAG: D-glycero-alpha-D-manno-heptose-1,7-bisphosphate 7-phosphatase [Ilumatobacteraceae bacterium]